MGRYTTVHSKPQGTGDARPTALQIIQDEHLQGQFTAQTIVITGATSGIGLETARALSATGATLFLTSRDMDRGNIALAGILEPGRIELVHMDNSSFNSIRAAAHVMLQKSKGHINILIANAGILGPETLQHTTDGHEMQFATNHLSHFLLFQLLKPALVSSASASFQSRVVIVSSSSHRASHLPESDNYNFEKSDYNFLAAYGQSKLANIYMANELDRRYGKKGIHATSLHPGGVNSNIGRNMPPRFVDQLLNIPGFVNELKSPEQGAATIVLAAVGREWEGIGGKYLEDCEEAMRGKDDGDGFGKGYVMQTYQEKEEERLWRDSLMMVGVDDDA